MPSLHDDPGMSLLAPSRHSHLAVTSRAGGLHGPVPALLAGVMTAPHDKSRSLGMLFMPTCLHGATLSSSEHAQKRLRRHSLIPPRRRSLVLLIRPIKVGVLQEFHSHLKLWQTDKFAYLAWYSWRKIEKEFHQDENIPTQWNMMKPPLRPICFILTQFRGSARNEQRIVCNCKAICHI